MTIRSTCVVGLQWGDEAKGKVVDLLTEQHDIVVRFNGGANAGHTVVVGDQVYKISLVPTGIVNPRLRSVIGNGVAVHPGLLLEELDALAARGVTIEGRLFLSNRAHVIFPYHLEEERLIEETAQAIGTTRRGIGPCYADKAIRTHAIRVGDLLDPEGLRRRLDEIVPFKNTSLAPLAKETRIFSAEEITREYAEYGRRLAPFVTDTFWYLHHALERGERLLLETAQGTLLDLDHGSFPYVTSSNSSVCGVASGCGVPIRKVERIVGIIKAYTSRVGKGPFPTELTDTTGEHIRTEGREFGTVTGRPRRCGWLDAVACRYTAMLNGIDYFAMMLLDVLSKLDELKVCIGYEIDGDSTNEFPLDAAVLERAKPIYRTLPGWCQPIRDCRRPEDLPRQARAYLDTISEYLGIPLLLCSVGPERDETIWFEPGK